MISSFFRPNLDIDAPGLEWPVDETWAKVIPRTYYLAASFFGIATM